MDDLRPFMEVALDAFGPRRLMFGSDWPVARLAVIFDPAIGMHIVLGQHGHPAPVRGPRKPDLSAMGMARHGQRCTTFGKAGKAVGVVHEHEPRRIVASGGQDVNHLGETHSTQSKPSATQSKVSRA